MDQGLTRVRKAAQEATLHLGFADSCFRRPLAVDPAVLASDHHDRNRDFGEDYGQPC
jgi:hypothetical protein